MPRRLALFDLDNTLLAGDSDHAWGEFLIAHKLVEEDSHRQKNDGFYQDYLKGELDIHAHVAFTLSPIFSCSSEQRIALHKIFMEHSIRPLLLGKAFDLVEEHRAADDYCLIITATNRFITEPIAELFAVDSLLATDVEILEDRLPGKILGTPCYQEGKILKLRNWLERNESGLSLKDSIFYTDSINDLPLLETVTTPIVVDPDQQLEQISAEKGWQSLSLRG